MNNVNFTHELIKGKIAEMVFEQMLRHSGGFTILNFGYEKVVPELARMEHNEESRQTLEAVRKAPDFAIINHEKKKVYLIEVKYRRKILPTSLLNDAKAIFESWNPAYLFVATPGGFYFDSVETVIEKSGSIDPLPIDGRISEDVQEKYLALLNEFIENPL